MLIDCHTHLGRNEHINARVDALLSSMDDAKIDKALVFAGDLNDYPTSDMLQEIAPHQDRLYGVAAWDFDYRTRHRYSRMFEQEVNLMELYKAGRIVAVKFYTGYYHTMPNELTNILSRMNEVGCPAIFHCGDCLNSVKCAKLKYAHPLNIDEVAVDYPNMNFIIAHCGFPWVKDAAEVCYKNENVYSDISGFVYKNFAGDDLVKFEKMLREFTDIASHEKLLFGTDWPISNQFAYVDALDELGWQTHLMTKIAIKAFKLNVKT